MQKVSIKNIGGRIIKDDNTYLLRDNAFGESLVLSSTWLRANRSTNGHKHDDQEEVYFFIKGQGEMEIDGERFDVKHDDVITINKGEFHRVHNTGSYGLYFVCVFEGQRNH
jgi:mannose-6-phosphate isomerase-like protein (cupin superfamily)